MLSLQALNERSIVILPTAKWLGKADIQPTPTDKTRDSGKELTEELYY